jgi:putative DNA methylase
MELMRNPDGVEVMGHLTLNIPDWYSDSTRRDLAGELAGYLAEQLNRLRPDEASAARVLRELMLNQRVG